MTIALVDCNNFYASCERLFQPQLQGQPVIVLSNNDGCVVARSAEVKALGIPMGLPYFKIQHLVSRHRIQVFSSNYALYGDLSARVVEVLKRFSPAVEIYSIDEAFLRLDITGDIHRLLQLRLKLQSKVGRGYPYPWASPRLRYWQRWQWRLVKRKQAYFT